MPEAVNLAVRPAFVADHFYYPAKPSHLRQSLAGDLHAAEAAVAGRAYAQVRRWRQRYSRVVLLDSTLDPHDACGALVLNGALPVARAHGLAPRLLGGCNSGDTCGDRHRVVGYGAIAFEPRPA